VKVIKTAVRVPNMNAIGERFMGSLRREALDHMLLIDETHLGKVARDYAAYFNHARPHQGLGHRVPNGVANDNVAGQIVVRPVLGRGILMASVGLAK
jgi:transposase InsO family protein